MKTIIVLVSVLAVFIQTTTADDIIAISWPTGVYSIDSASGSDQILGFSAYYGLNSLARSQEGEFYSADSSGNLLKIDPMTGGVSVAVPIDLGETNVNIPSMSFAPSGQLYIINRDGGDALWTLNEATGVGTYVGSVGGRILQGLAFSPGGTLYAWDINSGLYTVNTATGLATDVNASEGAAAQIQCLAFSPDGVLYGSQYALYTIDVATGVPTLIGGSLSDVRGMEFDTGSALRLSSTSLPNAIRLCFRSETNKTYQFQFKQDLGSTNNWSNLGPALIGTGSEICGTNNTGSGRRFYRVFASEITRACHALLEKKVLSMSSAKASQW